jgi:hypothetical protein
MIANTLSTLNDSAFNKLKLNSASVLSDISSNFLSGHNMVFLNYMLDAMLKPWL